MKLKRSSIYLIASVVAAGVILYIVFSSPEIMSFFNGLSTVMYDFVVNNPVSAYFGAFIISTFSNFTVFLPVPYALAIFLLGAQPFINPLLLALICGVGSGVGEISAYLIGLGGRKFIERKYEKNLKSIGALIERYGFWAIVLFAATPLPDDTLLIPLGVLRYNLAKALIACVFGKILLCSLLAFGGRLGWGFVELIFTGGGTIGTVLAIIGTILLIYFILKIDWSVVLNNKRKEKSVEEAKPEVDTCESLEE